MMNRRREMLLKKQGGGGHNLPAEYQEVEFIANGEMQYLVTHLNVNEGAGIHTIFQSLWIATGASGAYICGTYPDSTGRFAPLFTDSNQPFGFAFCPTKTYTKEIINPTDLMKHDYYFNYKNDGNVVWDGLTIEHSKLDFGFSHNPLYIFSRSTAGVFPCKLFVLTVTEGSEIVGNFVPCYRKTDEKVGLYDTINNEFYTVNGTPFTKGDDV